MSTKQDRISQLERDNASLRAALAKSNGFNGPSNDGFNYNDHAVQPSNHLVRSQSNMGRPCGNGNAMMTQYDSHPQAVRPQRAYSQQASNVTPFRSRGPIAPLASTPMSRSQSSQSQSRGDMQRSPGGPSPQPLQSIHEQGSLQGVGMDPIEFLAGRPNESSYLSMTSTNLSPNTLTQNHQGLSVTPPSLVSGSSALEDSPDMSRQHSSFGHWPTSTPMINSASQQSFFGEAPWGEHQPFNMAEVDDPKSYASSQDFVGFGGAFPSNENYENTMFLPLPESVPMDRSASNTSNSSIRSTGSNLKERLRERHEQVLRNGNTTIKPKPEQPGENASAAKKLPVTKSNAARRKQNKVTCPLCDDHPEFRGEHERNRHIAAKHCTTVTKFKCRDPAEVGLQATVQPKVPLKGCKACDSGKLYGAYYNAGAHLRRWHFNPKGSRGKGKSTEKRGGSAGGHWPEMDVLKAWFEECTVTEDPTKKLKSSEEKGMDNDLVGQEDSIDGVNLIDGDLPTYLDANTNFSMPDSQTIQASPMVPDLSQTSSFSGAGDNLFDFVTNPEPSFVDNASPFFGSGSSNAFTPPSNYDLWGQGHVGNAFPGSD